MKFEKNIGKTDKIVRVILAMILIMLGYYYSIAWLYVISLLLLITALTGYCMLYMPFKINTIEKKKK